MIDDNWSKKALAERGIAGRHVLNRWNKSRQIKDSHERSATNNNTATTRRPIRHIESDKHTRVYLVGTSSDGTVKAAGKADSGLLQHGIHRGKNK